MTEQSSSSSKPAGFLIRLLAELIEFFLFGLLLTFVLSQIISSNTLADLVQSLLLYLLALLLPVAILANLYRPFFTAQFGGNIGKLLTGLKVTNLQGSNISFKQGLLRYIIGYTFSTILFGLGFWSIIKDPEKRAFHDKIAGTKVVIRQNLWPIGLLALIALIFTHGFLLSQTSAKFSNSPLRSELGFLIINWDQQMQNQNQQSTQEASPSATPAY